jgi:hypothetical protein
VDGNTLGGISHMNELARPFVNLWNWVERTGGFPGQIVFVCSIVILILGALTWYGNKK